MLKKKWFRRLILIIGCIAALYIVFFITNVFINLSLRKYINSFDKVEYSSDRLIPEKENGYYTITTDRDLCVMHITDIHIGGGFWTYKNDKKTIYELISMLQAQKPDIVILGGDNTYALPGFGWNGGNTLNNKMVASTLISLFEHEEVYFSTVFGNHDTEAFDYSNRQEIGNLYMDEKYKYCFFEQQFTDEDAETIPSVSNQFIIIKNTNGDITKLLLLIDSNDYISKSLLSNILGKYDTIHDAQVDWAADTIKKLSKEAGLPDGEYLKTLMFMHIPIGEYRTALDDLFAETKDDKGKITGFVQNTNSKDTEFVEGCWAEEKVCFGGINNTEISPAEQDKTFEVLCDDMHSVEAVFSGHDHTNSAIVKYKGVFLSYGYSLDNEAYGDKIMYSGLQRGANIITISPDGSFTQEHKNAYTDYHCSTDKFVPVYLDHQLYPDMYRSLE